MSNVPAGINHVSDTALLVAGCRAMEAERPDALVRDPFAERLAGERGLAMYRALPHPEIMGFGLALRTRFIDELILEALASASLATVVNFGAGLDTRPWRLELPSDLRWLEVDFSAMLDYKDDLLAAEKPRCRLERLACDLNDAGQRARVYSAVGRGPALLLTEGLLMYLPAQTVHALARETPQESGIAHWICDIITTAFSEAIGGGGKRVVGHVQADDHLAGEKIVDTLYAHGWRTAVHRSYIKDVGFASERIKKMTAGQPGAIKPPPIETSDPAGVHRFGLTGKESLSGEAGTTLSSIQTPFVQ